MQQQPQLRDRIARLMEGLKREQARYDNLLGSRPESILAHANTYALSFTLDGLDAILMATSEKHLRDGVQFLIKQVMGKTASSFVQGELPTAVPLEHHEAMAFRRLHAQLVNLLRDLPEEEEEDA